MARIAIGNMTCGGCAKGVLATLGAAAPGVEVSIDLDRREVAVASAETAPLIAALRADGWEASAAAG